MAQSPLATHDPKVVFVIGVPRSGTTWTFLLLAQHPDVAGFQQSALFEALKPIEVWWKSTGGYGKRILTYNAARDANESAPQRTEHFVGEILERNALDELCRPLVRHVFQRISATTGRRTVVEQTPENLQVAEHILRLLPEAHFLHIIRDPRAVFCSQRTATRTWAAGQFSKSPRQVAEQWCEGLSQAAALQRLTPHYREIRYEDLLERGASKLMGIFEWLGLPANQDLCDRAIESCAIDKLRGSTLGPAQFFRRGQAQGWRAEATKAQVHAIEHVAGQQMEQFGYTLVSKDPSRRPSGELARQSAKRIVTPISQRAVPVLRTLRDRLKGWLE